MSDTDLYADYYGAYLHADKRCDELKGTTVWLHSNNHVLSRKVDAHERPECPECCA